jgi:hypothetical protein
LNSRRRHGNVTGLIRHLPLNNGRRRVDGCPQKNVGLQANFVLKSTETSRETNVYLFLDLLSRIQGKISPASECRTIIPFENSLCNFAFDEFTFDG